MQVIETNNEGLKRDFKIVVPAADIEEQISKRLGELSRTVRLPGFRPGKVPVALLRKRFGPAVMGEVLEKTVSESTQKAMTDRGMRPAMEPKIEITSFEEGADLEYTMAVEVLPEVELPDFAKIELERLTAEVPDTEIEEALTRIAEANRSTEPLAEARPSEKGDIVLIDFVGKIDGEEFAGGKAEGYELDLGSGSFIPGFEDQLIGAKAGDHVDVKVTFPETYGASELAGKDAVFEVDVKELRSSKAAAIDDELAKKLGLETLDALKQAIRDEREREFRELSRLRLKRALLDELAKHYDFAVPSGLMEQEFEGIWAQFEAEKERNPDAVKAEYGEKSEDEIKADLRQIAERRMRLGLVLAEVGRSNNIQVTQDDLNRAVMSEARRFPGQEQKVVEHYRSHPEAMNSLRAPILEERVVDFILEMASVSEKKVSPEELLRDPDAEEAGKGEPESQPKSDTASE